MLLLVAVAPIWGVIEAAPVCNVSEGLQEHSESSQCSGHGVCEDPGVCECDDGYNGTVCGECSAGYSEQCAPEEALCDGALAHEIEEKNFTTLFFCFGMVLLLGILLEFLVHFVKHAVHHEKWAKKIVDSLIAELVTLGIISFVLFLISNACWSETLHTDFFDLEVFEFLHMLLFITVAIFLATVMFLIVAGLVLLRCNAPVFEAASELVRQSRAASGGPPPAPPRRKNKKAKTKATTAASSDAPKNASTSLLGAASYGGVADAHADPETVEAGRSREDHGSKPPRPSIQDFMPSCGCCCSSRNKFNIQRWVRTLSSMHW